jgi:hypothetical protein
VVGVDRAVEIGTNLIADVSAKMLREKIVEAGRVSFPAALRPNYNLLYQAIRVEEKIPRAIEADPSKVPVPAVEKKVKKEVKNQVLEIRPYGVDEKPDLPVEKSR